MRSSRRAPSNAPFAALRFGRYALLERLGAGGMAEVWRARDDDAGQRIVALKRILPHLSAVPEISAMFRAEAAISARLVHANVVATLDVGEIDGRAFLAMQYVDGIDLSTLLTREPLPFWLAVHIARDIGHALAYVHSLHDELGAPLLLVHRDVSPSNIRLRSDGVAILLDFGIAKALTDTAAIKTRTGAVKGKPGYVAPEQLAGAAASQRSDQFALGVVMAEMMSAKLDASTPFGIIAGRASMRDPEHRYASTAELADALEALAHDESASAARAAAWLSEQAPFGSRAPQIAAEPTRTDLGRNRGASEPGRRRDGGWIAALAGAVLIAAVAGAAMLAPAPDAGPPLPPPTTQAPAPTLPTAAQTPVRDMAASAAPALPRTPARKRNDPKRRSPASPDKVLDQRFH